MKNRFLSITTIVLLISLSLSVFRIFSTNAPLSESSGEMYDNIGYLKVSTSWNLTGTHITINGNGDWATKATIYDWLNGLGTWADPYVIENVTIDGENSGTCINIINSDVPFIIRNCTFLNSGSGNRAGIRLDSVENGRLLNNTCSDNNQNGIRVEDCNNITISDNIIENNIIYGIIAISSDEMKVLSNIVNVNDEGIYLLESNYNVLGNNIVNDHVHDGLSLLRCKFNNISSNKISQARGIGIKIYNSKEINIYMNEAVNNTSHGIHYSHSHNGTIKNNTLSLNRIGIGVFESNYNLFTGNVICDNRDGCFTLDGLSIGNVYEYNYCGTCPTPPNPPNPPLPPPSAIPSYNIILLVISAALGIIILQLRRIITKKQSVISSR